MTVRHGTWVCSYIVLNKTHVFSEMRKVNSITFYYMYHRQSLSTLCRIVLFANNLLTPIQQGSPKDSYTIYRDTSSNFNYFL